MTEKELEAARRWRDSPETRKKFRAVKVRVRHIRIMKKDIMDNLMWRGYKKGGQKIRRCLAVARNLHDEVIELEREVDELINF